MKKILTLTDADIFPNAQAPNDVEHNLRLTVKFLAFDEEGKVALVGTRYRLLPGGGVEDGESMIEAVLREAKEEIGCVVEVGEEFAITEEVRTQIKRKQETHFFVAKVIGEKGEPETTQEDEQGLVVEWCDLGEALNILEKEKEAIPFESYNSCFNVRTHLAAVKEFIKKRK